MPNKSLLKKTLAYIKKNPKHWDQSSWHCGSSFCFGGWAVKLDGGRFPAYDDGCVFARADDPENDILTYYIGNRRFRVVTVLSRAERILKLNTHESANLFSTDNSLYDLEQLVKNLVS